MIDEISTKEEVLAAVKESGWSLKYASMEFINDRDVVLAAIENDLDSLEYAGPSLRFEMVECWKNAIEQGLIN